MVRAPDFYPDKVNVKVVVVVKNLVSVVITTYKRPFNMLQKAINSVLNQSHKNLELIIVDDNPKGDPNRKDVEINIEKLGEDRLKYIQHNDNRGACEARNTGIKKSKGKYIAFLDDDDEWMLNKLELQLQKFADRHVGLVYCDSYTITLRNNVPIEKEIRSHRISGMVYDELLEKNFVGSTSFVLLKKEALMECGFFNVNMQSSQDHELWLRISQKYKIEYVDVPLANYYIHESERISTNPNKRIQGLEKIIELNLPYLQEHRKVYGERKLLIIPYYYVRDGYRTALKKYWEAFCVYPFNMGLLSGILKTTLKKLS